MVLAVALLYAAPVMLAAPPDHKPPRHSEPPSRTEQAPPGEHPPTDPGAAEDRQELPLLELFPLDPSLHAPLDEAGVAELKEFVEREMPKLYRVMKHIERRKPEEFDRRFREIAPKLRHLKFIHENEPEVGELVIDHVQYTKQVRDLHQRLHEKMQRPLLHGRMTRKLRHLVKESVKVESQIVAWHVTRLAAKRGQRVEELMRLALKGDIDPQRLPPQAQQLLDEWTLATDDRRAEIEVELRILAEQRTSDELTLWELRADMLAKHPEQIIDRRVRHMVQVPPPGFERDWEHDKDRDHDRRRGEHRYGKPDRD